MIVDAHQHFWELGRFDYGWLEADELQPIRRSYLPDDLRPHLDNCGVTASVFVQTQHNLEETHWVCSLAEQHPWIAGVVGWVDLASSDCETQLQQLRQQPKFVGIRHITQDEPDDDFIVRDDVIRGLEVLQKHDVPFDLLFYEKHLRHAETLGRRLPELRMVIDHLSKPQIRRGRMSDDWRREIRTAAQFPNMYCKLSGMVTEADWKNWTVDDLRPYVLEVIDAFGPQRCMYGSDWPVCELAATYEQVFEALRQTVGNLSETEQAQIFGKTAAAFYRLNLADT